MHRQLVTFIRLAIIMVLLVLPADAVARPMTPVRAADIDAYLASKGSPMTGQGAAFVASGGRWQVDPRLLVAIAGAESSFGQITCAPFNAWGWGCPNGPYRFDSWADGIDTVMEGLRRNYLSEGRTTVALIHAKYAPVGASNDPTGLNNHWTINVTRFLVEMGGDPNDVDLDGVAGTLPLGPLGGPALENFGFIDEQQDDAARSERPVLLRAGEPAVLVVRVRNTGYVAWRGRDVRLSRVDGDARVVGAPFAALSSDAAIQPDEVASFVVQLAAAGNSAGAVTTRWRVEGPTGPFGSELERDVRLQVPAFVAAEPGVELRGRDDDDVVSVLVRIRNAGASTWLRAGEDGVVLGLAAHAGAAPAGVGWINERTAASMLERSVAPGEVATFALRARASSSVLALRPWSSGRWAGGDVAYVVLGDVSDGVVDRLRAQLARPS